jgi:zinc/manganese transport system substrate-binding protein
MQEPVHPIVRLLATLAVPAALCAAVAACGGTDGGSNGRPTILVTTSVLGDVVDHLVGDDADVEVLMPAGSDPHDFVPSAKQVISIREADAVIANGAGFEKGLDDALSAAADDGVDVFEAIDTVDTIGGKDEDEDDSEPVDPHFFTDPARMAVAARAIVDHLADRVDGLDTDRFRQRAAGYVEALNRLDADAEQILSTVPLERRKLVTNHDVFSYFADRYGFEVIGVVIPGGGTGSEPSAGELASLAATVTEEGVPAIFADSSSPTKLADALADEAGADVEVVELFTESLQPDDPDGDTYVDMVTTNARRIAEALA